MAGFDGDIPPVPHVNIDADDNLRAMVDEGLDVGENQVAHHHIRINAYGDARKKAKKAHIPDRGIDDPWKPLPINEYEGNNTPSNRC